MVSAVVRSVAGRHTRVAAFLYPRGTLFRVHPPRYYWLMERRRLFVTILMLVLFVSAGAPFVARAATAEELRAQIADILAEINYLRTQLNAVSAGQQAGTTTAEQPSYTVGSARASQAATFQYSRCPDLQFDLERGDVNADVAEEVSMLQRFLSQDSSIYPEGEITGYFGPATERAVQRFQERHGIVARGDYQSTGYGRVGPRTRWAIKNSCDSSLAPQSQAPTSPDPLDEFVVTSTSGSSSRTTYAPVGGVQTSGGPSTCFVQPDRGTAPLTVRARLLLGGSLCDGDLTYQIDWGDGSTSSPRVCSDTNQHYEQLTHTYLVPAVYPARLIQSHPNAQFADRSCSVTVAAVPESNDGTITGQCRSWTDGCNTCSRDYENGPARCTERYCTQYGAQQCYEYFPASAGATGDTLRVRVISKASGIMEFTARINVANSCDGGVYKIYFGDGESSVQPLAPGACQAFERTVRHTYANSGTYSAFLVKDDVEVDRITVVISDTTSSAGHSNVASVIVAIEEFIRSLFR